MRQFFPNHIGSFDKSLGADLRALSHIADALFKFLFRAGKGDLHSPIENVGMRQAILRQVAYVFPIAFDDVAIERRFGVQEQRKEIFGKIEIAVRWDMFEHRRLQKINARVDCVRKHFAPGWLFQETLDTVILVDDNDAISERVRHAREHERRHGFLSDGGRPERTLRENR